MTICFDLLGFRAAGRSRRVRALTELASLAAVAAPAELHVVAVGEAAFAARLAVGPGSRVASEASPDPSAMTYRAFGEANPAPVASGPVLVEAGDLGRLLDAEEGPADRDALLTGRLRGIETDRDDEWRSMNEVRVGKLRLVEALLAHGADAEARLVSPPPQFGYASGRLRVSLVGATPFLLAAMDADGVDPLIVPITDPGDGAVFEDTIRRLAA